MYGGFTLITRYLYPVRAQGDNPSGAAVERPLEGREAAGPAGEFEGARPRAWTRGETNCLIAFGVAVTLWVTPGVLALARGTDSSAYRLVSTRLDEGVVALLAAALLFLLPVDWKRRQFTVTWAQASRIDWGTILLFGGGLSLGRLMFTTGLAERIGRGLIGASGAESLWTVTAVMTAVAILATEVTSNTAATNMLVPVALAVSQAAGISPIPPALGVAFGASMAYMLPISTPPNAIVYGSGLVPVTAMIRCGLLLDILSFAVILAGLRLLCPLLGLL
jgi:sodium-dependent dicarboxylate transporter 2/3/5